MKKVCINKVILKGCCSGSQPCKQRDPETLRAARRLRMTDEMSSRSVSTPVIPQCLYAGYRSFLLRPILRIQTLRNDEAAGVRGFTLVELLVVVLIIGILSAVAIPMYQGAVDKSHWSTMLPGAKALKDAEEAIRMSNGLYTSNMDNLDVRMPSGDVQYTLETVNDDGSANVVRVTNSKLGDKVRLSNYLDENTFFGGQLHCEVKDGDERATRLCEKLLGGQELNTVGGYTRYLLDQSIDQATCGAAEKSWSTSKTTCYKDTAARCSALNMSSISGKDLCGWENTYGGGRDLLAEAACMGSAQESCPNMRVRQDGQCIGTGKGTCRYVKIYAGGVCEARHNESCEYGWVYDGGKCVAYKSGSCRGNTYEGTGCCEEGVPGQTNCPSNAPKC